MNGTRVLTQAIDAKTIAGYAILDDVTGHPILVLQITMPRDIYNEGIATVQYVMASLFLAGTLFGGVSIVIMEKTIFSRMSKLEADVFDIGAKGNFSSRLSLPGNDELTKLAELINKMLASLEESEKQLREAKRVAAIGETAAMVGHDLRNPLQAIIGAAFLLRTLESDLSEKGKTVLNTVEEAIQRADKIIRDLVEYSTDLHLELSTSDAKSLIDESLASTKIPENIHILNQTSAQPKVEVDVEKMRRVLLNLLQNAVDAMPNGGTLTIRNTESNDNLQLSIADTGEGIRDEILSTIWNPLITTKAKGMGYGLPIVKRFVEAHGGSVRVETQVGKGSTFTVSLPIKGAANTSNKSQIENAAAMIPS